MSTLEMASAVLPLLEILPDALVAFTIAFGAVTVEMASPLLEIAFGAVTFCLSNCAVTVASPPLLEILPDAFVAFPIAFGAVTVEMFSAVPLVLTTLSDARLPPPLRMTLSNAFMAFLIAFGAIFARVGAGIHSTPSLAPRSCRNKK